MANLHNFNVVGGLFFTSGILTVCEKVYLNQNTLSEALFNISRNEEIYVRKCGKFPLSLNCNLHKLKMAARDNLLRCHDSPVLLWLHCDPIDNRTLLELNYPSRS